MPETKDNRRIFSLADVGRSIQKTISERYGSLYWVKAEMNKLNLYAHSGHCFPELLEKKDGKMVAEMRAVLWNSDYQRINRQFLDIVREPLKDGIMILMQASIHYDPLYGLSLKIHDIDPAYALGHLEREKQESLARLRKDGVFMKNKSLPFPQVPKRLAIISVESSKGYADFIQIIERNPWQYHFEMDLFPALLQGDRAADSIIAQLNAIRQQLTAYDVVLIIRGGGGEVGLSIYNNHTLADTIARFPLPIMTGIGHSTNETVSEMVAHRSAITPSELADFLIQHFHNFAEPVKHASRVLTERIPVLLGQEQQHLERLAGNIHLSVHHALRLHGEQLAHLEWAVRSGALAVLQRKRHVLDEITRRLQQAGKIPSRESRIALDHIVRQIELMDPIHVLRRGYSITLSEDGKAILDPASLQKGMRIRTHLAMGTVDSTVNSTQPTANKLNPDKN